MPLLLFSADAVMFDAVARSTSPRRQPTNSVMPARNRPRLIRWDKMLLFISTLPCSCDSFRFEVGEGHTPIIARLNEGVTMEQFMEAFSENPDSAVSLVTLLGGMRREP